MAGSSALQVRGQNLASGSKEQRPFRSGKQAVEGPVIRSGVHGSDRLLAMRLYRLDVMKARSRDIIEREIISLRRDLWEMSNDLKNSLVRLYQQSLEDTQTENVTTDMKKSARSKSRPSIFQSNRKRPNYSDLDDGDKSRRAEKNNQSYIELIDRYKSRSLGFVSTVSDSLSPDISLHLPKRSHTTMLPARSGQTNPASSRKGKDNSPDELFDLFVRVNTDTNLKLRHSETASLGDNIKRVKLPTGVGNNSSIAWRHGKESSSIKTHGGDDNELESVSTDNNIAEYTGEPAQNIHSEQEVEHLKAKKKPFGKKKKTGKKGDSENEIFKIDFLDKEMRRRLLQKFDRNRSPDSNGNGKVKSKVAVTMPKIIRDSQLSRRASVLVKPKRDQADGSSMVSLTSGDIDTNSHQLPAISKSDS